MAPLLLVGGVCLWSLSDAPVGVMGQLQLIRALPGTTRAFVTEFDVTTFLASVSKGVGAFDESKMSTFEGQHLFGNVSKNAAKTRFWGSRIHRKLGYFARKPCDVPECLQYI